MEVFPLKTFYNTGRLNSISTVIYGIMEVFPLKNFIQYKTDVCIDWN